MRLRFVFALLPTVNTALNCLLCLCLVLQPLLQLYTEVSLKMPLLVLQLRPSKLSRPLTISIRLLSRYYIRRTHFSFSLQVM